MTKIAVPRIIVDAYWYDGLMAVITVYTKDDELAAAQIAKEIIEVIVGMRDLIGDNKVISIFNKGFFQKIFVWTCWIMLFNAILYIIPSFI